MSESTKLRRGCYVFWILALLVVANELVNFVLMCLHGGLSATRSIESIALIACFYGLWQGQYGLRWFIALILAGRGFLLLFALGTVLTLLFKETPEEGMGLFRLLAAAMAPFAIAGVLYLAAAAAILWVPSLQAYLQDRRLATMFRRIRG
jgi:hypothetical protein